MSFAIDIYDLLTLKIRKRCEVGHLRYMRNVFFYWAVAP